MSRPQHPPFRARPAAPILDGRRVEGAGAPRGVLGEITYTVLSDPPRSVAAGEKRAVPRQRTRLRTGKVILPDGRFLTECLVFDRSDTGSRLRLPAGIALTPAIQFYDDQNAVLHQADVVWRLEREVGIRFRAAPSTPQSRALAAAMRRRYYAVAD